MILTWLWVGFALSFAARDAGRPGAAPPWPVFGPRLIVLADGVDPRWIDPAGGTHVDERFNGKLPLGVYRAVRRDALPAGIADWVGARVVISGTDPNRTNEEEEPFVACKGRIAAIWAASVAAEDDDEGNHFLAEADDFGHVAPGWGWGYGHPLLVAEFAAEVGATCPTDTLVAAPEGPIADRLTRLERVAADAKVERAALRAVRASGFWSEQQAAYAASLEAWRAWVRRERVSESGVDFSDQLGWHARRRWDEATPRAWWDATPTVVTLDDATGTPRFIEVELGNMISCAAPRSWVLLDPSYAIVDFGSVHGERAYLDWNGDGAWDLFEDGWQSARVLAIGSGRVLGGYAAKALALYCPYEAVPPLGYDDEAPDGGSDDGVEGATDGAGDPQ